MDSKMHKLLLTRCDVDPDRGMVSAVECGACPRGSVVDGRSRVLCMGVTKFFTVPCYYDMRAAATMADCEACPHGRVHDDRLRVFCDRM